MMLRWMAVAVIILLAVSGCAEKREPEKMPILPSTPPAHPTKHKPFPPPTPKPQKIAGKWTQLQGLDGGDMHFIYSTSDGILFLSHGFGGVWRSEDGKNWKMIVQDGFVDLNFYDIVEFGNRLYAGSNKGLWTSDDRGLSWEKVETGFDYVDEGRYHVVSLAVYGDGVCFTAVLDKAYRGGKPGDGKLFCLEDGAVRELKVPASEEITVSAKGKFLFLSSPYSGLYVFDGGSWRRILDTKTTKVFVGDDYTLYAGTIGEWWYIGKYDGEKWTWKQVKVEGKNANTIFYFIKPDPINERRLWFGCGGVGTFYSQSFRGFGAAFVGVGCWDGEKLRDVKTNPNYATSIAFYGGEIDTPCGKATKRAFVTVGGQAVQETTDGGESWHNSYEGVYGDTINAINPITSGILAGSIVITAVSGTEIATNHGDSWMDVDFTIGKIEGKLPGYSWCAVSPSEKVKGRYDLLISTGYPGNFGGDGVFGVDVTCLKTKSGRCIERLIEGVHYEMVIVGDTLYAGNMDYGIDVLDLKTLEQSKITVGKSGIPIVRLYDGKLYFETYGDRYAGDGWRWTGRSGKVYVLEGEPKLVYGEYLINFFVRNGELIGLARDYLVFKSGENLIKAALPRKDYTDMAVNWEKGLIFLSTDGEGVFYTSLEELKKGRVQLVEMNDGLMTLKIRNLAYYDGYLFAGTRGHSVWRIKIG